MLCLAKGDMKLFLKAEEGWSAYTKNVSKNETKMHNKLSIQKVHKYVS